MRDYENLADYRNTGNPDNRGSPDEWMHNHGIARATMVATPTPQTVHDTVTVSSAPTIIATPVARYSTGDIVWRNDSNYDTDLHRSRGMLILRVNEQSYNYQYVSKDDGEILWSQIYPNEEIDIIVSFEAIYTRKLDHTLSITSQYPSRAAFEETLSKDLF